MTGLNVTKVKIYNLDGLTVFSTDAKQIGEDKSGNAGFGRAKAGETARATMHALKEMGLQLSIDDFGTGYSSLNYLKRFPLDKLKIDRSFVRGLPSDSDDAAIAKAVLGMARALRLKVIAEGVENENQAEFLRLHGCDEIQGYYFARPLPADQFVRFLQDKAVHVGVHVG